MPVSFSSSLALDYKWNKKTQKKNNQTMNHTFIRIFTQADSASSSLWALKLHGFIYWYSSFVLALLWENMAVDLSPPNCSVTRSSNSLAPCGKNPSSASFPPQFFMSLLTFMTIKKQIYCVTCCEFYFTMENITLFRGHSFLTTGINKGNVNQLW